MLAGDGGPHRWDERLLALELELLLAGRCRTKAHPPGTFSDRSTTLQPSNHA